MTTTPAAMPLRYMRWWRLGGYLLVATVIVFSLVPHGPQIDMRQGDKIGHFLAYGSLMFWFAQLEGGLGRRVGYALAFVALGIALEFLQGLTDYRSFDMMDMLANSAGVVLGWLVAWPRGNTLFARIENLIDRSS